MELFFKAAAAVMIALVLGQALGKTDISLALSMVVCVMTGVLILAYLEPVLDFLKELQRLGDLHGSMLETLLKILGISIVTELTQMICKDSGNASLGHAMQTLGTAVILWLSIPIFRTLIGLLETILGEL